MPTILLAAPHLPATALEPVAVAIASTAARLAAEERAEQAEGRLADGERVGSMGSFSWDIEHDRNHWSDELYRIYGLEPAETAPGFEAFIALLEPGDRDRVRGILTRAVEEGEPFAMEERIVRPDGQRRTLWSCGEVVTDAEGRPVRIAGVCRDVTGERTAEEEAATANRRVAAAEVQRRQALELNDTVVQGLVAVSWRLEDREHQRDLEGTRRIVASTLTAAKGIMEDLLHSASRDGAPEGLLRSTHASRAGELGAGPSAPATTPDGDTPVDALSVVRTPDGDAPGEPPERRRVVLADDAAEVRAVLRQLLRRREDVEVVGEAVDGAQAVDLVVERRPDVVVLDLGMPVLDGLGAARRIRELVPTTRIVVFSGYPSAAMRERALAAGADDFVEKTSTLEGLVRALTGPAVVLHG